MGSLHYTGWYWNVDIFHSVFQYQCDEGIDVEAFHGFSNLHCSSVWTVDELLSYHQLCISVIFCVCVLCSYFYVKLSQLLGDFEFDSSVKRRLLTLKKFHCALL